MPKTDQQDSQGYKAEPRVPSEAAPSASLVYATTVFGRIEPSIVTLAKPFWTAWVHLHFSNGSKFGDTAVGTIGRNPLGYQSHYSQPRDHAMNKGGELRGESEESVKRRRAKRAAIATFICSAVLFVGSFVLISAFDAAIAGAIVLLISLALWVLGFGLALLAQP